MTDGPAFAADLYQEPDMVRVVRAKVSDGDEQIKAVVSPGEDFVAPPGWFELITIGNALPSGAARGAGVPPERQV